MSGFTGNIGRPLETDVRDVATLITDERSDAVETRELRFEDGGRTREGGGGGVGLTGCGLTMYGTTGVVLARQDPECFCLRANQTTASVIKPHDPPYGPYVRGQYIHVKGNRLL